MIICRLTNSGGIWYEKVKKGFIIVLRGKEGLTGLET